ncbi:MAG: ATP-grasp domain-containing protein [Acidaminococcaceae bacterium]
MKVLVFLSAFPYINEFLTEYTEYYKVLIADKKSKLNQAELEHYYDEVFIIDDIQRKEDVEKIFIKIMETKEIKAVYTTYEPVVEVAGYLRERFNIPGMNYSEALKVRNKHLMKKTAVENGIATAKFSLVKSLKELCAFIKEAGYPIVIKPVSGCATSYTFKISSFGSFFNVNVIKMLCRHKEFLAEKFIDGHEYHCNSIIVNGEIVFSSVGKNLYNNMETVLDSKPKGSIAFPAYCDNDRPIRDIKSFNERLVNCYGIRDGISHAEVFVDSRGVIYLGEIAARIGGVPIGDCIKNTSGVDINKAYIDAPIDNFQAGSINERPVFTGYLTFPSKAGELVTISDESDFSHLDGIKEIKVLNKPGDRLMRQKNTAVRTGYIIIEDESYDRLKEKLLDAFQSFRLTVK